MRLRWGEALSVLCVHIGVVIRTRLVGHPTERSALAIMSASLVKSCPDLWIPGGTWRAQILGISHIKPISAFAASLVPTTSWPSPGPSRPSAPLMTKRRRAYQKRFSRRRCCPSRLGQPDGMGTRTSRTTSNLEKGPLMTFRRHRLGLVFRCLAPIPSNSRDSCPRYRSSLQTMGFARREFFSSSSLPSILPPSSRTS